MAWTIRPYHRKGVWIMDMNEVRAKVQDIMDRNRGQCMNTCKGPNDSTLEFWRVKASLVIVQYWDNPSHSGCTHYINSATSTWDDMEKELAAL